jgi:hypothetical protein
MMKTMYLTLTITVSAQMISESTPRTESGVGRIPWWGGSTP